MKRYQQAFDTLEAKQQGAFVPFITLADPTIEQSYAIISTLIEAGADALELGLPFSDPVADGPTIQRANLRALAAGASIAACFKLLARVRTNYPDIPMGLLVYANLVVSNGMESFYQRCAESGVDSVLIADVPTRESAPFIRAAQAYNIAPIFIAPPDGSAERLQEVARFSEGYVYLLSRAGVTGNETQMAAPATSVINSLAAAHSAPPLLGFGISTPTHVEAALAAGAAGVISGSAVVQIIEQNVQSPATMLSELQSFTRQMKAATNSLSTPVTTADN